MSNTQTNNNIIEKIIKYYNYNFKNYKKQNICILCGDQFEVLDNQKFILDECDCCKIENTLIDFVYCGYSSTFLEYIYYLECKKTKETLYNLTIPLYIGNIFDKDILEIILKYLKKYILTKYDFKILKEYYKLRIDYSSLTYRSYIKNNDQIKKMENDNEIFQDKLRKL